MKNKKKIGCIIVIILIAIIGLFFLLKPNFSKNKSNTEKLKETLSTQDPYEDNSELDTSKLNYNLELTEIFDNVKISGKRLENIYGVKVSEEKLNKSEQDIVDSIDEDVTTTKVYNIEFLDKNKKTIDPSDDVTVYLDNYSSNKNYIDGIQKNSYCAFIQMNNGEPTELEGANSFGDDDSQVIYFKTAKSGRVLVINYKGDEKSE